jgi:hypothetical protein
MWPFTEWRPFLRRHSARRWRLRVQEMVAFLATPGAVAMSLATDIGRWDQRMMDVTNMCIYIYYNIIYIYNNNINTNNLIMYIYIIVYRYVRYVYLKNSSNIL